MALQFAANVVPPHPPYPPTDTGTWYSCIDPARRRFPSRLTYGEPPKAGVPIALRTGNALGFGQRLPVRQMREGQQGREQAARRSPKAHDRRDSHAPGERVLPSRSSASPVATDVPPARGPSWLHTFDSLRNRDFMYLWLGIIFLMTGIQMQMIVRGYLTYEITSSPFLLGVVNAGFALPMLALALFGGAVADRLDRKVIIQIGQALSAALALFVGVSVTTGTVTWVHMLAVSMAQGGLFAFLMPARQALIPQLVDRENVSNAISLEAAAMSATTLVAPAIGGGLYNIIGPDGVYYLIVGCCVVAMLLTAGVRPPRDDGERPKSEMVGEIRQGLVYVSGTPLVMALLVLGLVTALLAMPFRFLMPIFVVDVYGRGPEALGLLVTIMGLGSFLGSLFIASIGRWRRGSILLGSSFISGFALLLVALIPSYLTAAAVMVLLGLGDAGRRTLNHALIMEEVEDRYRGRVMSVFMMNYGLTPLGVLPAAAVAEALGGQAAVGILAVLLLAATATMVVTQKGLRRIS